MTKPFVGVMYAISIPHGTIKRAGREEDTPAAIPFQFHMVRLKDLEMRRPRRHNLFQFHMVRLKGLLDHDVIVKELHFNSTWYD